MAEITRLEELIPLYALGVLEGDENREAERLIKEGSPEARELMRQYGDVTSLLPYSAGGAAPDPRVRREILEYARNSARRRRPVQSGGFMEGLRPFFFGLGGALAAGVIVFLFVNNLSLRGTLREEKAAVGDLSAKVSGQDEEIKSLKNLLADKEGMVGGLQAKLASLEELTEFMKDQEIVLIKMERTKPEIKAAGRVLWDTRENDALLYSLDLPKVPPGKTYQWWVIVNGVPKSVGTFQVDSGGDSVIKIDSLRKFGDGKIQRFLVTIEPAGGAQKPTGSALLRGQSI